MSLVQIRKRALTVETTFHDFGPIPPQPLKLAAASAVVANPYAGKYEPDLMPFMAELRSYSIEVGIQDAPRADEILFTLVMGTGGRVNSPLGGLLKEDAKGADGRR